jgi:hypothetical protein
MGADMPTEGQLDAQAVAAITAAVARTAIAEKIGSLAPDVEDDTQALVVLHLAEAYANLAVEPPRARAG